MLFALSAPNLDGAQVTKLLQPSFRTLYARIATYCHHSTY